MWLGFFWLFFVSAAVVMFVVECRFINSKNPLPGHRRGVLSVIWDNGYSWSDQNLSSHIKIEYARPLPDVR